MGSVKHVPVTIRLRIAVGKLLILEVPEWGPAS